MVYDRAVEIQQTKYYKRWQNNLRSYAKISQREKSESPAPSPISSNLSSLIEPKELNLAIPSLSATNLNAIIEPSELNFNCEF